MNPFEAPQAPLNDTPVYRPRPTWPWWVNAVLCDPPDRTADVAAGKSYLLFTLGVIALSVLSFFYFPILFRASILAVLLLPFVLWHWCAIWWVDRHQGWPQ
jgi:hypothetical protein